MNAIDVYTLLCPDYNYLQPLELSMLVSLFFFPFRRQLKQKATEKKPDKAIIPPTVNLSNDTFFL